jgi:monoamine oxidase
MNNLSRRRFLEMVGVAGGSTAVYQTSVAMGILRETGPVARLDLKDVGKARKSVAILGAGISGLTIAYELERVGYDCTVIEASHRIGGRNMTVRRGDIIDEMGNKQVCNFDDDPDMYFNCGPARIPGHHRRTMHYCQALQVELIVKANINRMAYVHDPDRFDGKPVLRAEYMADARGFISELVSKAVDKNAFDQPLSEEEQVRIRDFAKSFGDLNAKGNYVGSARAGYSSGGFLSHGTIKKPMDFGALLDSDYWRDGLADGESFDWGEPLMEAKGGMDNIVKGFVNNIKSPIVVNAQVQDIQLRDQGVDVAYNHKGERKQLSVDYCFNSIPAHFMAGIPNNFSRDYADGLAALKRGNFFKIGLQMSERFWEREGIYGGGTQTNQPIKEIWYPSHGINSKKGVLLGAYGLRSESAFFEKMSTEERIKFAADCGDKIHKGYSSYIEAGVTIPWGRINHMMGCGSGMSDEDQDRYFKRVQAPEGNHYMIGDQISFHSSWQEGAFASAENALLDLDKRVRATSTSTGVG